MPIRPENRDRYPPDWPQIRARILARAGNACERCRVQNHAVGARRRRSDREFLPALPLGEIGLPLVWPKPGTEAWCGMGEHREWRRMIRIVLTVAHLDHTPENCDESNLLALCQRCHLAHEHHQRNAYRTRREGRAMDMFENSP